VEMFPSPSTLLHSSVCDNIIHAVPRRPDKTRQPRNWVAAQYAIRAPPPRRAFRSTLGLIAGTMAAILSQNRARLQQSIILEGKQWGRAGSTSAW
jgi:hypothetical protein